MSTFRVTFTNSTQRVIDSLIAKSGRSMENISKVAFGLVIIAVRETLKGNKLAIVDRQGNLLQEVILADSEF